MKQSILLTGSVSVDQIMKYEGKFQDYLQPDKLDKVSISVLLSGLKRTRGGIAANIAYSLALLGEKPILLASVGEDQQDYVNDLGKMGVEINDVHFSALPTATFCVITDKENCQIGGFYPGAMGEAKTLSLQTFVQQKPVVVLSAHDPDQMVKQIDEVATYELDLIFDVGQQVMALPRVAVLKALSLCKLLILNEYEMELLAKTINKSVNQVIKMVPTAIVTLGDKGTHLYEQINNYQEVLIPTVQNMKVIDPTGAGDAYRAGVLYGWVRHWSLEKSIKLGCIVASFALEQVGTQVHRFTWEQLNTRYYQTYHEGVYEN